MNTRLNETAPQILEALDAEVEKGGWDQPHRLYFVYAVADGGLGLGDLYRLSEFELMRHAPHPLTPLLGLAHVLRLHREEVLRELPGELYGWLLVTETWMLSIPKHGPEAEDSRRVQRERRIHLDPRRKEARMMILAPLSGGVTSRVHIRGEGLQSPPDEGMDGDIPRAMVELAAATVGQ